MQEDRAEEALRRTIDRALLVAAFVSLACGAAVMLVGLLW